MLYVTTREKYDAFTTARVLKTDRGPEGGLYLPFRMPRYSIGELLEMKDRSFGQNVADMLNRFFSSRFSGWDVEFCIGRYPVRVAPMGQKVLVAECWRNLDGSYEKMERQIAARICGCGAREVTITSWMRIGIRVAILFGTYCEMLRQDTVDVRQKLDVAVAEGDLSLMMAVWYAKEMGLPVANIICGCEDGSSTWNLIHNGQIRPGDREPAQELERLIFDIFGADEAVRFAQCVERGEGYSVPLESRLSLRDMIFAAVVSDDRMESVIPNVYRTSAYIMEPAAAISYAALMDRRARTGESRFALLLADRNPVDASREVAGAMGLTEEKLKELLGR